MVWLLVNLYYNNLNPFLFKHILCICIQQISLLKTFKLTRAYQNNQKLGNPQSVNYKQGSKNLEHTYPVCHGGLLCLYFNKSFSLEDFSLIICVPWYVLII